jgi:hypothetical protein
VNYLISKQGKSFYLESISTGKQGHVAQWLADDISRVIEKNSHFNVAGVVTDNTSANKLAWKMLGKKFPGKFFYGLSLRFSFSLRSFRVCGSRSPFVGEGPFGLKNLYAGGLGRISDLRTRFRDLLHAFSCFECAADRYASRERHHSFGETMPHTMVQYEALL